MDSSEKPHKDDGVIRINRMDPGHVDIVLGSRTDSSPPRPPREQRPWGLIGLCALLAILSLCLMASQLRRHSPDLLPASQATSLPPPSQTGPAQN